MATASMVCVTGAPQPLISAACELINCTNSVVIKSQAGRCPASIRFDGYGRRGQTSRILARSRIQSAPDGVHFHSAATLQESSPNRWVRYSMKGAAVGVGIVSGFVGVLILNGLRTFLEASAAGFGEEIESKSMAKQLSGGGGGDKTGGNGGGGRDDGGHGHSTSAEGVSWGDEEEKRSKVGEELEVSVIIPAINEEICIDATIKWVMRLSPPAAHIIVVDGGSSDRTVAIAEENGVTVVKSRRGRAIQLNSGAAVAKQKTMGKESILCFVHADTKVPLDLVSIVRQTLSDSTTVLGGFVPIAAVPGRILWGMSLHNVIKTWYSPLVYSPVGFSRGLRALFGDQVMFCRSTDFQAVGGFDEALPIMEDADLCRRMHLAGTAGWPRGKRRGRVRMVNRVVETSARRLIKWGPLRSTYIHFVIGLSYAFGASPETLHGLYKRMYVDVR